MKQKLYNWALVYGAISTFGIYAMLTSKHILIGIAASIVTFISLGVGFRILRQVDNAVKQEKRGQEAERARKERIKSFYKK